MRSIRDGLSPSSLDAVPESKRNNKLERKNLIKIKEVQQ